jgi:membrane protein DedA with SNARE-associated domain
MNVSAGGPSLPWEGKAKGADKAIVLGIMLSAVYGFATLPLIPMLIDSHPVLLAAIRGGTTSIVNLGARAGTGDGNLIVAMLIGIPAMMMFDWAYWWAGRRWGERGLHLMMGESRKTESRLARVKHWTHKYGAVLVVISYWQPVPNPLVYAAAGWAGMRLATFILLDILGTLLWTGTWAILGYSIGQPVVSAVKQFAHYSNYATIALVVVIVARQIWTTRRLVMDANRRTAAVAAAKAAPAID